METERRFFDRFVVKYFNRDFCIFNYIMQYHLMVISLLILFTGFSCVDKSPENTPLVFDTFHHNFGEMFEGEQRQHTFTIYNQGKIDQSIDVSSTCSCVIVENFDAIIKAHETGTITITMDSTGYTEELKRMVVVKSGIADPIYLELKGRIRQAFSITPSFLWLGETSHSAKELKGDITITNNLNYSYDINLNNNFNKDYIGVNLIKEQPGFHYRLKVFCRRPYKEGYVFDTITLMTTNQSKKMITINYGFYNAPVIRVFPKTIFLNSSTKNDWQLRSVVVENNTTKPVTLSNLSISQNLCDINVLEKKMGKYFVIELHFSPFIDEFNNIQLMFTVHNKSINKNFTIPVNRIN